MSRFHIKTWLEGRGLQAAAFGLAGCLMAALAGGTGETLLIGSTGDSFAPPPLPKRENSPVESRLPFLLPDDLPDHFAEKSVGVVIRDRIIQVEFKVGLSTAELRRQCLRWGRELVPDVTDSEAMRIFAELLSERTGELLEVNIGGAVVSPSSIETLPGGQHHVSAVVNLRYPISEEVGQVDLVILDRSFEDLDGAIRLGCKSLGKAMLRRTNAALMVVRATRQEYSGKSLAERRDLSTIQARVIWAPSRP